MSKSSLIKIIAVLAILIIFKSMPVINYNLGKNALQKQNYIEAYKRLRKAYYSDKKDKNYRYYYMQVLLKLNPSATVQKEVFALSKGDDEAHLLAEDKIAQWQNNILLNIGENYIEQAAGDNGIVRWDTKKFPLKVFVEPNKNMPDYYKANILSAVLQWQEVADIIKFVYTDSANKADIIIKTAPTPNDICNGNECKYIVGYTVPKIKGKLLQQMTITLYEKDPLGNFFSDKEIYNTALHEMGHALGIMGHSYSSSDLMYMNSNFHIHNNYSFQYLSSQDINTIRLLYKLIPDITNTHSDKLDTKGLVYAPIILGDTEQITKRKLQEAQNYIQNAPDLPGGYIDLGVAYSELGKKKEALKAIEKALELSKSPNDKFISYFNLSIIYLENKNYDKALFYAEQAKQISDTEDVKELIMNINHAKNK